MNEWNASEDERAAAIATAQAYSDRITPIVSVRLKPELTECFSVFLRVTNNPQNASALNMWGLEKAKWKDILTNGILSNTKESLKITAYHAVRIGELNKQIVDSLSDLPLAINESIGGGDMTVINAEYQAFILACRRCLDQLSYAISGFFKNECSSFRDLGTFLSKQKKLSIYADPLIEIYNQHEPNFHGWLLSRENKQSIRDSLAHTKSISVGTLNVNGGGVFFVGMDAPSAEFVHQNVAEITLNLFFKIQACVDELVIKTAENLDEFLSSIAKAPE